MDMIPLYMIFENFREIRNLVGGKSTKNKNAPYYNDGRNNMHIKLELNLKLCRKPKNIS